MIILQGTGVCAGIAIAPLRLAAPQSLEVSSTPITDIQPELDRFEACRIAAIAQLGTLAESAAKTLGAQNAALFEVHQMMLEDLDYLDAITDTIRTHSVCAQYAVRKVSGEFAQTFAQMDNAYMQARAADIIDISQRLIALLLGQSLCAISLTEPAVLFADDFTPSQTAQFDRTKVLGLVTRFGSKNSHTAIFARTLMIPAVIGLGEQVQLDNIAATVIIDGETGEVILDPDEKTLAEKTAKKEALATEGARLCTYKGKTSQTKSGQKLSTLANIGSPLDMDAVLQNDAEGIGLFRSEFLYLESSNYPTEDAQYEAYREVAQKMGQKPVIIRTLDIGADKQADYFSLPAEENPALGLRAIRICLTRPEMFKTQLKALLRAACHGNIQIMLPMITSVWEIQKAKELLAEAKAELAQEGKAFQQEVPLGIMIETPAAAMISDLLAPEVDFFSVGTNDLTQYTMALDRQNEGLAPFANEHHPAVLRLIELAAKNAHANGIWIGICGELGADTALTQFFAKIGIDELSVSPSAILPLREVICALD